MQYVRVRTAGEQTVYAFERNRVRIGRAASNDLVLDHESVGDTQAELHLLGAVYRIIHRGIARPTLVNGRPIVTGVDLAPGDIVGIGPYALETLAEMPRRPLGSETDETFLTALARDPSNDATRAVYADWLEERGRADEAGYLRHQLAIQAVDPLALHRRHEDDLETPSGRIALHRFRELAALLPAAWRLAVARTLLDNCTPPLGVTCPQRWDLLGPTERPDERRCGACGKTVQYLPTVTLARQLARRGQIVVVDAINFRLDGDLHTDPRSSASPLPCLSIGRHFDPVPPRRVHTEPAPDTERDPPREPDT